MNIYEKIDAIFQDDLTQKPQWADELFRELYEIKTLLKQQQTTIKKIDKNYYSFVKLFREQMKPDIANNIYPTFHYNGKTYGIDLKGLIYNKETQKTLPKDEASLKGEFNGLKGEFNGLKGEFNGLKGEFNGLKGEFNLLRGEFDTFKAEIRGEFDTFKAEIRADFNALEGKFDTKFSQLETRFESAQVKMQETIISTMKWYIGGAGVVLILLKALDLFIK